MAKKKSMLTRAAKGIPYGNVSNTEVRNILTEISKQVFGGITEHEMEDTLDEFGGYCPYTGENIRHRYDNNLGGYVTDHIYPQNKEYCGLNVKGNLVLVDKEANEKKGDQSVENFLLNSTWLSDIDKLGRTRQQRLDAIKAFQAACGYDPVKIRTIVSPLMEKWYEEVRVIQEQCVSDTLDELKSIGLHALRPKITAGVPAATGGKTGKKLSTELIFHPTDEETFKNDLLLSKKAHFVLTYDSGAVKTTPWDAKNFDGTSNLRGNIQSKTFWRNRTKEGLTKVEAYID